MSGTCQSSEGTSDCFRVLTSKGAFFLFFVSVLIPVNPLPALNGRLAFLIPSIPFRRVGRSSPPSTSGSAMTTLAAELRLGPDPSSREEMDDSELSEGRIGRDGKSDDGRGRGRLDGRRRDAWDEGPGPATAGDGVVRGLTGGGTRVEEEGSAGEGSEKALRGLGGMSELARPLRSPKLSENVGMDGESGWMYVGEEETSVVFGERRDGTTRSL